MIDWHASTKEKIDHIKEKVLSGKFPELLDKYDDDNFDMLSISEDPMYCLVTLGKEIDDDKNAFHFMLPGPMDVATMSQFQWLMDALGLEYGKRDMYVAFKTKEELDNAVVKVWLTGWKQNWVLESYMVENDLFGKLCPAHIRDRLKAIIGG